MKMSHTVTMRTTTTTTTSAIIINTGYFGTWNGMLKLLQSLVGAAVLGLVGYYGTHHGGKYSRGYAGVAEETLMLLVSFACLITTFLLFLASLCSIMSSTVLPKTLFESVYHFFAFVFYLSASIALLVYLSDQKSAYYKPAGYEGKMAAAILGLINSVLYFMSLFFTFRTFRAG